MASFTVTNENPTRATPYHLSLAILAGLDAWLPARTPAMGKGVAVRMGY